MTVHRISWYLTDIPMGLSSSFTTYAYNSPPTHTSTKLFNTKEQAEAFQSKLKEAAETLNISYRMVTTIQEEQVN